MPAAKEIYIPSPKKPKNVKILLFLYVFRKNRKYSRPPRTIQGGGATLLTKNKRNELNNDTIRNGFPFRV